MNPFPTSLCHRCEHNKYVPGKQSVFLMCRARPEKYLPQPVRVCPVFQEKPGGPGAQ